MKSAEASRGMEKSRRGYARSTRFLRAVLDTRPEGVLVLAGGREVVYANRLAGELWGYEAGEMAGLEMGQLFPREIALVDWGEVAVEMGKPVLVEALRKDGGGVDLEVRISRMAFEGEEFWMLTVKPLQERLEESLVEEQARVFESLEAFAAGLAHEFNNVLTGVMGNLDLAMEYGAKRGRMEPALMEAAFAATLRAREVTRDLFQLTSGERFIQCASALPELVCEAARRALSGTRVQVNYQFARDLGAAHIDATQTGETLHQLLRFAGERMGGDAGRLQVGAENFRVGPGEGGFGGELLPGDYVRLFLVIPGGALDPRECERLFEPYRVGGSALRGMALAICRASVRRQGGHLRAVLNKAADLRLEVFLPACRDVANETVSLLRVEDSLGGGCRVLVMDDEELVRLVLKRSLESLGHQVVTVADGEEVLVRYEESRSLGERFDMVFLDLQILQGMGGKEVCRELLDLDPFATCVLMSGRTGDEVMMDSARHGFVENLKKPFDLHEIGELMSRLEERLGGRNAAGKEEWEGVVPMVFREECSNIVEVDFRFPPDGA